MYYSSFGLLALIVHIIINIDVLKKEATVVVSPTRNRYRLFLYALGTYYVTDILWGVLYENHFIIPTYIDTTIYFFAMALSILLWTRFVVSFIDNRGKFGNILIISGWVILAFQVLALIVNPFYPVVFGFGEQKEYLPGNLRYASLIMQMVLFIFTSLYTLIVSAKTTGKERTHNMTVGLSGIIMSVFILLQSLEPFLPFYAVGCLLATCLIHTFVTRDLIIEHYRGMEQAKKMAYRDALTGVRNKLAYLDALKDIEIRRESKELNQFAVVVFDLNGLKKINDEYGHDAGDTYIQNGCTIICQIYKHSPVFRIGGDEFVAVLEKEDFENRDSLMDAFNKKVEENRIYDRVIISGGMAVYDPAEDRDYNDVFRRADQKMYERKNYLKSRGC